jgi:hypothetical protein
MLHQAVEVVLSGLAPFTYEKLKVKYYIPCCHKIFSLRHPSHDLSTTLRRSSEQPFDFTMHYHRHREPAYVLVNRLKDVAKHLSGACRILKQLMQIIET